MRVGAHEAKFGRDDNGVRGNEAELGASEGGARWGMGVGGSESGMGGSEGGVGVCDRYWATERMRNNWARTPMRCRIQSTVQAGVS